MRGNKKEVRTFWLRPASFLALALTFALAPALAVSADQVDQACGPDAKSPKAGAGGQASQKAQQCQAARDAQDGANASSALSKVWGGVATVCGGICAASLGGTAPNSAICTGASVGGAGTDAIISKNYAAALAPVGQQAAMQAQSAMSKSGEEGAKEGSKEGKEAGKAAEKKKDRDLSSCFAAATAASTAYSNHTNMKNSEASAAAALDAVAASDTKAPAGDKSEAAAFNAPADGAAGGPVQLGAGDAGAAADPKAACASARETNSVPDTLRCATANDPRLPAYVNTPQFARDFQKTAGMGLQDFFAKNDSPTRTITQATSGSLNATQTERLAAVMGAMERGEMGAMNFADTSSVYTSGGAASEGSSGGDGMEGMGEALAGLMEQLLPKDPQAEKQIAGMKMVIFANQNRSPAAIPEEVAGNKALSIFDRVSYRYYFAGRRMLGGGA